MALAPQPTETPPAPPVPTEYMPQAVRAAGANADDIQAAYIASLQPDPVVPVPAPPAPVVAAEPPVTPQGNDDVPPPAEPGTPESKWEHSFKSLQGRFKAESAKRDKMIAELQAALSQRSAPAPQAPPQAPQPQPIDDEFTAEERETWGEDLTATISRIAAAKAAKAVQQFAPVLNQTMESVAIQRENQMRDWLNTQIDFEAVNVDDGFKTWLLLRDAMSGVIRQELLNTAWLSADGPRVLAICNGFLAENPGGSVQPVAQPPAAPPEIQAPRQPQVPMTNLVAPGRAQVQAPQTPSPQKPIYTRKDVADFYAQKNRGFYRGRETEAAGYEQEIALASVEGRII